MRTIIYMFLLFTTFIAGCASFPKEENLSLEEVNRASWYFNYEVLDKNIVRPASTVFEKTPKPIRSGISNFLSNLNEPLYFVNNILQVKFADSATTALRFLTNSTLGVLGIFDVAHQVGLEQKKETFSETLGYYGIENGAFVMLPILGPSTVRNSTGDFLDFLVYPLSIMTSAQVTGKFALEGLERRVELKSYEQLLEDAVDPYIFVKDTYLQNDSFRVSDGAEVNIISEDVLSDFENFFDSIDEPSGN